MTLRRVVRSAGSTDRADLTEVAGPAGMPVSGRRPGPKGRPAVCRWFAALAAVLLAVAGCGAGSGQSASTPVSIPAAPSAAGPSESGVHTGTARSRLPVTVPALPPSEVSGAAVSGAAVSGASPGTAGTAASSATTVTATAHPSSRGGAGRATSQSPPAQPAGSTAPATSSAPATATSTATSIATSTAPAAATSTAPGRGLAVDLASCAGCTVIATHRDVVGALSAALATTSRGAVLLSVRSGGAIAGVINVPYGASFPTPGGKLLPCDGSGRCIVTARQPNGDAVLSAFELTAGGSWRDVSGNDAFPSATARGAATDVTGDGLLDIAIQESAGALTTWMVLAWSGDRFTVLGCAPASDSVPVAAALSKDSCLS